MTSVMCAICRDSLSLQNNISNKPCTLTCGHVFHENCVYKWTERSLTCPHCRLPTRPGHVIKLFFDISEDTPAPIIEVNALQREVQNLNLTLERLREDYRAKCEEYSTLHQRHSTTQKWNADLRKTVTMLNNRLDRLREMKTSYIQQKNELKLALSALEKEKAKSSRQSNELKRFQRINTLLDGSLEEASNIINTEESVDFDTLKICFKTLKRDFTSLLKSETNMKNDYSQLFNQNKVLEKKYSNLLEKFSIQERIIQAQKACPPNPSNEPAHMEQLSSSSNAAPLVQQNVSHEPAEQQSSDTTMDIDVVESTSQQNISSKNMIMLRRSPRNLSKGSSRSNAGNKIISKTKLSYDGLGGHSAEDKFPKAKLRACRIVSNRRK